MIRSAIAILSVDCNPWCGVPRCSAAAVDDEDEDEDDPNLVLVGHPQLAGDLGKEDDASDDDQPICMLESADSSADERSIPPASNIDYV